MQEQKFDMDFTPERAERAKQTLLRLFADQMGWDFDSLVIERHPVEGKGEQ